MFDWNLLLESRKLYRVESRKSTSTGARRHQIYRGRRCHRRRRMCALLILFYFPTVSLRWRTRSLIGCTTPEFKRYFVTAASIDHFDSCVELLRTISPNFGNITYVVYSLKLGHYERECLTYNFQWIELRNFNFTSVHNTRRDASASAELYLRPTKSDVDKE